MALQAFAPPMESFRHGREFSVWLGLIPRQSSTGEKPKLGKISKMDQRDLRRLLVAGAMATVGWAVLLHHSDTGSQYLSIRYTTPRGWPKRESSSPWGLPEPGPASSGQLPAERTDHPREVIEAALPHVVQNKVEAAYARSDLFERRRRLMADWAVYLAYLAGERRATERD